MTQAVDFRAIKAAVNMADILAHYGLLEQMETDGAGLPVYVPSMKRTRRLFTRRQIAAGIIASAVRPKAM